MGTLTSFQWVERYIKDPEGEIDGFWDSGVLIWVDWRDYDEWVIQGVCERLPETARFRYEIRDSVLPRGSDILLGRDGALTAIPYAPDRMDRDTTLKAVQAQLAPDWQLRCFVYSMADDTVGFCLLSAAEWRELEAAFGARAVARHFQPIGPKSRIFG